MNDVFNEVAEGAQQETTESDASLRGESPAGKMFFGDEPDMRDIMRSSGHELIDERFFHSFAGHLTNACYIFMKSRIVRGLFRLSLPALATADNVLCRFDRFNQYAEEGIWFLRAR